MSFLYPWFLYALSLVAIPIIIHLFNFRRYKTVYFPNVKFLKEVKEETAVRSKVKHWLVLLARILAVIFLVLAFAQPVIPLQKKQTAAAENRAISIYIDNSFSMNAETDEEPLINRAKRKAREIANAYSENDRFQLITNEFETRQQRFISKEELLTLLDEIHLTSRVRKLDEVQKMQSKLFEEQHVGNGIAYWISDFQKNIVDFEEDTTQTTYLIPLQPLKQQNIYIDSSWLEKPMVYIDQANQLFVKIANKGEQDIESSRLTLSINGQVKAISDFSVPENSAIVDTVNFTVKDPGWKSLEVAVTDYPITFDDKYYLTLNVTAQVNVLAINDEGKSKYLEALFTSVEKFQFQNQSVNQLDYARLQSFSLIILNNLISIPSGLANELEEYLKAGGALVIFPNLKADLTSYNRFFNDIGVNHLTGIVDEEQKITYLNREHEIFQDVFEEIPDNVALPSAKAYYKFSKAVQTTEKKLLGFRNGASFLSHYEYGLGNAYVCSTPLDEDYTDFPVHAIFVPMLYKMALSGGSSKKAAYILGKDEVIEVDNKLDNVDEIYKMKGKEGEFFPQQRALGPKVLLSLGDQVTEAGIYEIYREGSPDKEYVALNYNREESKMDYYTPSELKDNYADDHVRVIDAVQGSITEYVKELNKGIILWKVCIILALIFLGIEVLLLRLLP